MTNKTPNKTKTPVGGLILGSDPIEFNAGRKTITLKVRNTGDEHERVINEERADKLGFKNAKK